MKPAVKNRPPKIAGWLLARTANARIRYSAIGDFEEQFRLIAKQRGLTAAKFWYWWHVARSMPSFAADSLYWSIAMFKNYLKTAFRNLVKQKIFSFINLSGLAAGLACFILILLYVHDEIRFDNVHKNKDHIYRIITISGDSHYGVIGGPAAPTFRTEFPEVVNAVRLASTGRKKIEIGSNTFYDSNYLFSDPAIFEMFSFDFLQGDARTALTEPNSVVLNEDAAAKYFGASDVLGKRIAVEGMGDLKVTGILGKIPSNSHLSFSMLFPMKNYSHKFLTLDNWNALGFTTYVQLEPQASSKSLESKLADYITENDLGSMYLQPMADIHFNSAHIQVNRNYNPSDKTVVYIITVVGFLILFIACFNFMNLATARATDRHKEVGLRKVVGATFSQLVRQFLGEAILLTTIACIIALLLVHYFLPIFNSFTSKALSFATLGEYTLLSALLGLVLLVGVVGGSYPALIQSKQSPSCSLRGEKQSQKGTPLRRALVIAQFSISIVMIICTLTIQKQLNYVRTKTLGLNKDQILAIEINSDNVRKNTSTIKAQIERRSSVRSVALSSAIPFKGRLGSAAIELVGSSSTQLVQSQLMSIDDRFVPTYQIEIIEGANLSQEFGDYSRTALINETAVKAFGRTNPVGQALGVAGEERTVVGVVKDFHYASLHREIGPLVMLAGEGEDIDFFSIKSSAQGIPPLAKHLSELIRKYDQRNPLELTFLDQAFENLYRSEERLQAIFQYMASLAVVISCLGLFGLAAYTAERRRKEIGIRKVLGASVKQIAALLSKEFTIWVALASVIAWPVAYFLLNSWLTDFAYRVNLGIDVFALAGILALLIAWFTIGLLAVRAAVSNPIDSLRTE